MHFREQGRSLQLIRTIYDPQKRRGVQVVVARLPQYSYTIPDHVRELLTPDEVTQLTDYLTVVEEGKKKQWQTSHLWSLAGDIDQAVAALDAGISPKDADALWQAMANLSKALKKSGYPRPLKTKTSKSKVVDTAAVQSEPSQLSL